MIEIKGGQWESERGAIQIVFPWLGLGLYEIKGAQWDSERGAIQIVFPWLVCILPVMMVHMVFKIPVFCHYVHSFFLLFL